MTAIDQDLTKASFHEATLTGISRKGSTVNLTLDDVHVASIQSAAVAEIEGVSAILRDGLPVDCIDMEAADGEILTLRREGGQIVLAVEWNDFAAKSQETVVYSLLGQKIELRIKLP
jgi:hypothetical protein